MHEKVIFEYSRAGRGATDQWPQPAPVDIPKALRRKTAPLLPEVSELETVRHFTRLSHLNFSIDTHFYPLGSCTMKYNPKACNQYAMLPEFLSRHPLAPESHSQGFLTCMYELQEMLKEVTGMQSVSLTPMAGAHGEFAGVAMIRAYHRARGDLARTEIIVPEAAHGTNPATATMCGCVVREIPVRPDGDVDMEALKAAVGPKTAGIMLTNPSTLGVFERRIEEVAKIVHTAGGLLYYDGANLNAILGKVRPGDMGFDVIHMNLHKTFSTPHGGGGAWCGSSRCERKARAISAHSDRRQGQREISLADRSRPAPIHRPPVGLHGQRWRVTSRIHLHAVAGPRRHVAGR
jgi:glycine dehydrogenase subunit 2